MVCKRASGEAGACVPELNLGNLLRRSKARPRRSRAGARADSQERCGGAPVALARPRKIEESPDPVRSYVEAYNNRGLSYEVLGRRAEAIADFRKAQSIDSADQVSKQQLRMLGF
jgi:tetratricopeptide (TPR) repeat protein